MAIDIDEARKTDRPESKFKVGQVVAVKSLSRQPIFRVLKVIC